MVCAMSPLDSYHPSSPGSLQPSSLPAWSPWSRGAAAAEAPYSTSPTTPATPASSFSSVTEDTNLSLHYRSMSLASESPSPWVSDEYDLPPEPARSGGSGQDATPQKRGRGRPRKHALKPQAELSKGTSARSKTGCLTCRRRKKKCDESGFPCLNCQRTANVICEGYPPLKLDCGSPSKDGQRSRPYSQFSQFPRTIRGVDDEMDQRLLDHFNDSFSNVLSVGQDRDNPFKTIVLPMAFRNRRLMHAILCLSALRLGRREPSARIQARQEYHLSQAAGGVEDINHGSKEELEDSVIAKALIFCLMAIFSDDVARQKQYTFHLDIINQLMSKKKKNECQDTPFSNMMNSFRLHSSICKSITSLNHKYMAVDEFNIPAYMDLSNVTPLLGIHDPVFWYLSKITNLRDWVRSRRSQGDIPVVNAIIAAEADDLDRGLRSLSPLVPRRLENTRESNLLHKLSMLYRQCVSIYLDRTHLPSAPNPKFSASVEQGLKYIDDLHSGPSVKAVLLMPLFLLSCAAFEETHRERLREMFSELHTYRESGNVESAYKVVSRTWQLMDDGDDRSWDWETTMHDMGLEFLIS